MSQKPVIFKTLMEFCPSDENLELAVRAIARKKRVITADDLHQLDFAVEAVEAAKKRKVLRRPSRFSVDCEDTTKRLKAIEGYVFGQSTEASKQ